MSFIQNEDVKSEADLTGASPAGDKTQLINTTKIYDVKNADILDTTLRKNKYDATVAPAVTDDSDSDYQPGSVWVDVTNDISYRCVDSTVGAAIWNDDTAGSGGGGGGSTVKIMYVKYVVGNNVGGGTSVAATWTKRTLNTTSGDGTVGTLSGSVLTLTAGTYFIKGVQLFSKAGAISTRMRNTSDASDAILGTTGLHSTAANVANINSMMMDVVTIAATKNFEFQYYTSSGVGNGLGTAAGNGQSEVYVQYEIMEIS